LKSLKLLKEKTQASDSLMKNKAKELNLQKKSFELLKKQKIELEVNLTKSERKNFELQEKLLQQESQPKINEFDFEKDLDSLTKENISMQ